MLQKIRIALLRCDWVLLVNTFLLAVLGGVALYSVNLGIDATSLTLVVKQGSFLFVGLIIMIFVMSTDYRLWQPIYPWAYILAVFVLLVVFTPLGAVVRGTRSWIDFGFFIWQPVELVKVLLILSLAGYLGKEGRRLRTGKPLIVCGLAVGFLMMLTILQPDLGSAMMLFAIWLGMVVLLGISKWQISLMVLFFVFVGTFGWLFVLKDYQKTRLLIFLDPSQDPLGSGYNLTQSLIAAGSGGFFGRGIGFGSQSQLKFLPESQSDFIFAVIAEELGLAGVLLLLVLYGVLGWRLLRIAKGSRNSFGQILVVGAFLAIFAQACTNIATNLGLLPVTGVPLPLISAGGSYLLAVLVMLGLVQSVKIHSS